MARNMFRQAVRNILKYSFDSVLVTTEILLNEGFGNDHPFSQYIFSFTEIIILLGSPFMGAQDKIIDVLESKIIEMEKSKRPDKICTSLIPLSMNLPIDVIIRSNVWHDLRPDLQFLEEVLLLSLGPAGLVKACTFQTTRTHMTSRRSNVVVA